jgi:hypothetical protein
MDKALGRGEGDKPGLEGAVMQMKTSFWLKMSIFQVGQVAVGMAAIEDIVEVGVFSEGCLA